MFVTGVSFDTFVNKKGFCFKGRQFFRCDESASRVTSPESPRRSAIVIKVNLCEKLSRLGFSTTMSGLTTDCVSGVKHEGEATGELNSIDCG